MLGRKTNPTQLKLAMASIAKLKNVQFFYFTPDNVQYENRKILGRFHNGEKWEEKLFEYPDYIYDRMLFRGVQKYQKLYDEFSHIPFNNEKKKGGPIDKTDIYELLRKSTEFQTYLIPYIEVSGRQDVLGYLKKYKNIVCKANSGSFGLSVYFIKNLEKYIEVRLHKQIFKYTKDEFIEFVDNTFIQTKSKYVIQPYIQSRTNDGNPFDLRVHLMKDRNGKWSIVRIYPRIGARNSIISNLHLGGSTCDLTTFLTKHITIKDRKTFTKSLRTFALKFAD